MRWGDDSCYFDRFLNLVCSPISRGDFDTQGWTAHAKAYAPKQFRTQMVFENRFRRSDLGAVSTILRHAVGLDDRLVRVPGPLNSVTQIPSVGRVLRGQVADADHNPSDQVLALAPYSASIKAARSLGHSVCNHRSQHSGAVHPCIKKSHSGAPGMKGSFDPLWRGTGGSGTTMAGSVSSEQPGDKNQTLVVFALTSAGTQL